VFKSLTPIITACGLHPHQSSAWAKRFGLTSERTGSKLQPYGPKAGSKEFIMQTKFSQAWLSLLLFFSCVAQAPGAERTYFLIAERIGPPLESYVVPMTKAEDIAEARRQLYEISQIERRGLVVQIERGKDWINRNYVAPGAPPWSWHVIQFNFFADTSGRRDGKPSDVEQELEIWLAPPEDGIIFLTYYTIIAEIQPPVILSVQPGSSGNELRWHSFGTNFLYTVETSSTADRKAGRPRPARLGPSAEQTGSIP
jgi:hypothetical protein